MYDTGLSFYSEREYPTIVRSGTASFSSGSNPVTLNLAPISANETYFVFAEMGGRRVVLAESGNLFLRGTSYVNNGRLYAYISNNRPSSGTIYWRIYGD